MAEIDIERRGGPKRWPWALAALLLLLVVGTTWYLAGPGADRIGTDTDTVGTFTPRPAEPTSPAAPPGTAPAPGQPDVIVP
jgi:hypothetical protein